MPCCDREILASRSEIQVGNISVRKSGVSFSVNSFVLFSGNTKFVLYSETLVSVQDIVFFGIAVAEACQDEPATIVLQTRHLSRGHAICARLWVLPPGV